MRPTTYDSSVPGHSTSRLLRTCFRLPAIPLYSPSSTGVLVHIWYMEPAQRRSLSVTSTGSWSTGCSSDSRANRMSTLLNSVTVAGHELRLTKTLNGIAVHLAASDVELRRNLLRRGSSCTTGGLLQRASTTELVSSPLAMSPTTDSRGAERAQSGLLEARAAALVAGWSRGGPSRRRSRFLLTP